MVLARERGVVIQVLHLVFLFLFFSVRPIQSFSLMAGNFRDLESMLNEMDLLAQDISLRPNCLHYKDLEQYLDTQYRLLREDFYNPLRQSVGKFITLARQSQGEAMKMKNVTFTETAVWSRIRSCSANLFLTDPITGATTVSLTTSHLLRTKGKC